MITGKIILVFRRCHCTVLHDCWFGYNSEFLFARHGMCSSNGILFSVRGGKSEKVLRTSVNANWKKHTQKKVSVSWHNWAICQNGQWFWIILAWTVICDCFELIYVLRNIKHCRPWSDCQMRISLIWVCTVPGVYAWNN